MISQARARSALRLAAVRLAAEAGWGDVDEVELMLRRRLRATEVDPDAPVDLADAIAQGGGVGWLVPGQLLVYVHEVAHRLPSPATPDPIPDGHYVILSIRSGDGPPGSPGIWRTSSSRCLTWRAVRGAVQVAHREAQRLRDRLRAAA